MTTEIIEAIGLWIVMPICIVLLLLIAFGIDIRIRK